MPRTTGRTRARVAACLLLAVLGPGTAACTWSGDDSGSRTGASFSTPPGPSHPLDGAPAAQVLETARTSLLAAPIARVAGRLAAGTSVVSFDITTRRDGQASGWFSPDPKAGRAAFKVIGRDLYLGGDDAYHRAALGQAAVAPLHGKWVVSPRTDPGLARMMTFVDRRSFAATALQLDAATVTVSADGKQFLLHSGTLTLAVSRDAQTRPLSVREDRDAPANTSAITFGYPTAIDLAPPPASAVLRRATTKTPAPTKTSKATSPAAKTSSRG